jgi:membrane protein
MFRYLKHTLLPYFRSTVLPSKPAQLLIQTGLKWDRDNVAGMAAALSYYALFSLFPLLLILLSILGALVGPETEAFRSIQMAIVRYLPAEVHDLIRDTVIALNNNSVGAGIIGSALLLWASTTVFSILRQSVNRIWQTPNRASESGSAVDMVIFFMTNKLFAFLLVLGTGLLILTSLVSNIVVKAIIGLTTNFTETFTFIEIDELRLTGGLQVSSSVLLLSLTISVLLKVLPSIRLSWNDVWLGALVTAFLLVGLQQLTTNSVVSIGGRFLSYGVIGSVMILMLWIFLTCQIFLVGCEISYIYAHLFGSRRRENLS